MPKCALITGAAGGIGYACVKQLLKDGFLIVAMDVIQKSLASEMFGTLKNVIYFEGSIASAEDRKKVVDVAVENYGRIDALINVAGIAPTVRADILEMTEESYDKVMEINTKGTLFLTQLVAKQMLSQPADDKIRGTIVNISSISAYTSSINRGEYCISKAGVSMITKLFADRLANEGILVNEIRPGIIKTGMTSTVKEKYDKLIDEGLLPIKRWGLPEDIANAVSVLCSGKLSYTTGQSIDVDGGFHIRRL
ncbi:MAG TPA: 3-ketoacyl-ACP reductase [Clostridiales bacterium]|nr:3-ketoacyl-ACP reductase [Clostridiales bacterium]